MCIIVDINVFQPVFASDNADHSHYCCVEEHIRSGKSKLIIGGTKFWDELRKNLGQLRVIGELNRQNRIKEAPCEKVDALQKEIETTFSDPGFNDKHIVALAYTANARLVCTRDIVLTKYLKKREFYNKHKDIPRIYNDSSRPNTLPTGAFRPKCTLCASDG